MNSHLRRLWALAPMLGLFSCRGHDALRSLQVVSALNVSGDCSFTTEGELMSLGYFDPAVPDVSHYSVGLLVQNNLGLTEDLVTTWTATTAVETHPIQVQTVEACWYLASSGSSPQRKATPDGALVDCATLPASQNASYPTGSTIPAEVENNKVALVLPIMTPSQLRAIFGESFSPTDVPSRGLVDSKNPDLSEPGATVHLSGLDTTTYDFAPADPGPATAARAAAWGDRYPETPEAVVVYQFRAVGRTSGGGVLHSNWFSFPVTVCPKCTLAACGVLAQASCAKGPCPNGSPCINGACADPTQTCGVVTLFTGSVPNLSGAACLPAQNMPGVAFPGCSPVGCSQ